MSDDANLHSDLLSPTAPNSQDQLTLPPPTVNVEGPRPWTERIAPWWHTVLLIAILIGFSLAGANTQHKFTHLHGRAVLYGLTVLWEWVLVGYILLGIRKRSSLRELIGGRWRSVEDALLDIAMGFGFWIVALIVLAALGLAMGLAHANQIAEAKQKLGFIAPKSGLELGLFFLLSATAGFCEEVIFRGYLLRQCASLTRSAWGGLALQAVVFGASHAYEGGKRMLLIAVYGAMFGVLTLARKSLRPGMLAHFLHDASAGIALQKLLG